MGFRETWVRFLSALEMTRLLLFFVLFFVFVFIIGTKVDKKLECHNIYPL